MSYYDVDATKAAVEAYTRRRGEGVCMPNRYLSRREGDVVILENVRGELARYRVREDGRVRRLRAVKTDSD